MKKYLVCIDSDGCAIDSMEIKHRRCFGPYIVDVWHLEQWKDAVLTRWNEINLYTMTRGINRFLGLEMMLAEVDEAYCRIDGLEEYRRWCRNTTTFSNAAVMTLIDQGAHPIFEKVMDWSNRVNRGVRELHEEIRPFDGVAEALVQIHECADIAIVSSANPQAVQDEWTRFGLMEMVTHVMAQDAGTKADCIRKLLESGYCQDCVLMIGDAPGDKRAAQDNGVSFYPILAGKETRAWQNLIKHSFPRFINGEFSCQYQMALDDEFWNNLKRDSYIS